MTTGCHRQILWQYQEQNLFSWLLVLSPDKAASLSQSWINDIPQQNENILEVVNKFCMTPQVYALLAFHLCSGDSVSRNALPDSCKGILHNSYEKPILSSLETFILELYLSSVRIEIPPSEQSIFL